MSSLSSIDTSQYTTPLAASFIPFQSEGAKAYEDAKALNVESVDKEEAPQDVDLSQYYANVVPQEFNPDVQQQVNMASQTLTNAISAAMANGGLSTQDALNIQKAKSAYEATVNSTNTHSTFELQVG